MTSYELDHPLIEGIEKSRPPIDATIPAGLTFFESGRILTAEEADQFLINPSAFVLGFRETFDYADPDGPVKLIKKGEVPSGDGEWDEAQLDLHYPGKIVNGLYRALRALGSSRRPPGVHLNVGTYKRRSLDSL